MSLINPTEREIYEECELPKSQHTIVKKDPVQHNEIRLFHKSAKCFFFGAHIFLRISCVLSYQLDSNLLNRNFLRLPLVLKVSISPEKASFNVNSALFVVFIQAAT